MKNKALKKLDKLDESLNQLLSDLDSYTNEQLNQRPENGGWSVTQILNHLILSEKGSIAYCNKKLSFNPKLKSAGLVSELRLKVIQTYMSLPLKVKAPSIVGTEALPPTDDLDNLKALWKKHRSDVQEFINTLPDEYLKKEIYKHPMGFRLSLVGMLGFFEAHFKTHQKQVYNAIK